jgi:small neutral amino acid transporter SnatA (MarC family)
VFVAALGLLFVAFPFTTPETSAFLGLRRSIRIARVLGLLLAALGAWIVIAG